MTIAPYKSKEPEPDASFTTTGTDTGILSGLETGATYTITGLVPDPFTFTASGTEQVFAGVSEGTITIVKKGDGSTTTDSDSQELTVTKPEKPDASAADCTTAENNDGKLSGVTEKMEYRKAGTNEWITGTKSGEISGLESGAYFVRYKADGARLASENQELTIKPFEKSGGDTCQTKISLNAGSHGSASITAAPDGTLDLIAKPDEGYQLQKWQVITGVVSVIDDKSFLVGKDDVSLLALFEKKENPCPPCPPRPEPQDPDGMDFFRLFGELPKTGLTAPKGKTMPLSVNYKPVNMELQIPGLNVFSEIVTVPVTDEGYAVAWLGNDAGLLEGFALPGEGISVIAGHNTLNAEEFGPFAAIGQMDEGERFFVMCIGKIRVIYCHTEML